MSTEWPTGNEPPESPNYNQEADEDESADEEAEGQDPTPE
jgi:hypothetical protein